MMCPACELPNRGGATQCKRCGVPLERSCVGCGGPIQEGVTLCGNCRTERVPAALGAPVANLADADLVALGGGEDTETATALPLQPKLVGRRPLVERLLGLVERAEAQRELAFVALTGPPGMGKTRLAGELVRLLEERSRPPRLLEAVCGGAGAPPYAPFAKMLRDRIGVRSSDTPLAARGRISAAATALLPASRATEVAHLIAQLLDVPFPDSPVVEPLADTPIQLESRTYIALRRFFAADAAAQPLVLVFDTLERASPETVNLIHYLAAGLASSPIAIVCVGRPTLFEIHPSFGEGDVTLQRIEIGPLSDDETDALVRELAQSAAEVPPALLAHAREKLAGVPRALVELVRYLLETGVIAEKSSGERSFDPERLRSTPLPATLEGILGARLRAMEIQERDLLEKAAACGEAFWLDALVMLVRAAACDPIHGGDPDGPTLGEIAAAGDRTRAEVEAALDLLAKRGLLAEQHHSTIPGEREYRFAYAPWWDVIYDEIGTDARRRYHRLIAQWLELRPEGRGEEAQEEIGRHLERAGDGGGAALRYRRAADAARVRYYNDRAIRLYSAALECLGPGDLSSRIHLWHDLGSVFQLKGDFDAALGAFERMLRLAWVVASRAKAAVAFNKMGRVYRQKGELPLAVDYLERGLDLFEQADDQRGIAGSLDDIGQVSWLLSRYGEALDRSAAALEIRRRLGDRRAIASSLVNIGHIERHRGLFDAANACYAEALDIRTGLDDKNGIAHCRGGLGMIHFQRGDIDDARAEWEAALELAESIGALPLQARLMNHLGEAARTLGHHGEARTRFEGAEALARDVDDRRVLSEALRNLGLLDLASGNAAPAQDRCQQALDIATQAGIRVDVGRALLALGEVHAATLFGEIRSGANPAEDYFARGVALFREIGNEAELALGLERFGKYRVERGDVDAGRALLTETQEIFTRLGMRSDTLRRVIGEL